MCEGKALARSVGQMLMRKAKEKVNRNITPLLDPKLRRRITRKCRESEVVVGGAGEPVMLA